ncbi:MAG: rod shape-determining protein MreC [Planctomycetes bacterium]|nr:rod shape-determining protein MreC [Planctomycetota bacterium]
MTRKWVGISKGMVFACGLLMGVIFLFLVPREAAGRLQLAYAHVFRWPLAMGRVVRTQATTSTRSISPQEYQDLLKACQQLRNRSANVEKELEEAKHQIELLTKLKAKSGLEHMQIIPAKVDAQVQDEMTISRGQDSGVAVGQYVLSLTEDRIDDQCVIGVISAVSAKGAKVRLFSDASSRLPVRIAGLNVGKVMEGRGDGVAQIARQVPRDHTIHVRDAVYAQAKRGQLDVSVIVAEISQCKRDPDYPTMWDITVRPVCDLADLNDVVVLKAASAP